MAQYYPIFLRVEGRSCLVIGGGEVAERKVLTLLQAGARVTVISPSVTPQLATLANDRRIVHRQATYARSDVHGFSLIFAATDDDELHAVIAQDAEAAGALLNVVDQPRLCSFIVPAVVQRGDFVVAVSTGGASPALARRIREELEERFGREYAHGLTLLRAVRRHLRAEARPFSERRRILTTLARSALLDLLRAGEMAEIDRLLSSALGEETSVARLGVQLD
jgi:precorrin-2 dehydrogenase